MPQAYRARILHFLDEPAVAGEIAWQYLEDGLLVVEQGRVVAVGPAQTLLKDLTVPVEHFPNHLILPGFVDTHIHYPQTEMIAAYGEQLLSWLNHYTFPAETKFSDPHHAAVVASFFPRRTSAQRHYYGTCIRHCAPRVGGGVFPRGAETRPAHDRR